MSSHFLYQQNSTLGVTRIDLVLSLYDKVINLVEEGRRWLEQNEESQARPLLVKAQILVAGLAAGIDPQQGQLAVTFSRLYEFVVYSLTAGSLESTASALATLRSLQEAFQEIREQAVELERSGAIPPLDHQQSLQVRA